MPSTCTRKNRRNRRRRGGASEPGAYPFSAGMGAASAQSLAQGASYAAAHGGQHGGVMDLFEDASGQHMKGGVAPVGYPSVELPESLRQAARIDGLDAKYAAIAGMQDGGRRRRRGRKASRKSRKSRKASRKARKSRKGRKSSRAQRKGRKASRRSRSQRRRRGGSLSGAPLNGNADVSSFYGDASGPKMLLSSYSGAGLHPDWKNVSSYTPKA